MHVRIRERDGGRTESTIELLGLQESLSALGLTATGSEARSGEHFEVHANFSAQPPLGQVMDIPVVLGVVPYSHHPDLNAAVTLNGLRAELQAFGITNREELKIRLRANWTPTMICQTVRERDLVLAVMLWALRRIVSGFPIRNRRGQPEFRDALLERYGNRCVVTGCGIVSLLEAAQFGRFAQKPTTAPENGLLLRASSDCLTLLTRTYPTALVLPLSALRRSMRHRLAR